MHYSYLVSYNKLRVWVGVMKLNDLKINEEGVIISVKAPLNIKRRLMDIGFIKGVSIMPILNSSSMRAYNIKGTVIGVRKEDTADIEVER